MQGLVLAAFAWVVGWAAREAWRWARGASGRERAVVAALAALAGAVRVVVPPGIGETNVRTAAFLEGLRPERWAYGVALPTIERALLPPGAHLAAIFDLAVAFGIAGVLATAWLAREAGAARSTALLAGGLLALSPVAARFAHTDAPGTFEVPLYLIGLVAWLRHAARPTGGAWTAAAAGVGLAAVCRPEALLLVPLVPLANVAGGRPIPWRAGRTWAAIAATVTLVALHVAGVLVHNPPAGPERAGLGTAPALLVHGWRHLVWLDPRFSSPVPALAAVSGVVLAPPSWGRRLAWAVLALATASFVFDATWSPAFVGAVNAARHQLRSLPFFAILAAQGAVALGGHLGLPGRGGRLVPVVVLAASAWSCRTLATTNTVHAELAFLRAGLPRVPDGCTVVTWVPPDDRGLTIPGGLLSADAGRRHDWVYLRTGDEAPTGSCVIWYRAADCATRPPAGAPEDVCARFEARHALRPLAVAELPAVPWSFERYTEDPVRVGFYEVTGPAAP
jgi:hypothetical protein